jgi:SAM-dependent methyltransferase
MKYNCGCINEKEKFGVLHCVYKCHHHVSWLLTHSEDSMEHYSGMGCLRSGIPHNKTYIAELVENINPLDQNVLIAPTPKAHMLEVGCGIGNYVPFFLKQGWDYEAIETSHFAAYWTSNCFDVVVHDKPLEELDQTYGYDLIFGAHVFEHMNDAPSMLWKCKRMLNEGGKIVIIIPDDTDPLNPSHFWFFNKTNLKDTLEHIGFMNIRMIMRKIVAHENFIYCVAERGTR